MRLGDPDYGKLLLGRCELFNADQTGGACRLSQWARAADVDLGPLWDRGIATTIAPVAFLDDRFEFCEPDDEDCREAVVIEVLDADGVTAVELVAFDARRPNRWARLLGTGALLGGDAVTSPSTFRGGQPLRLFRSPFTWIRAGCDGTVLLGEDAVVHIAQVPGPVAGEDLDHGRQLTRLLKGYMPPSQILVPEGAAA